MSRWLLLGPVGRCIWHRLNALCQTHTSAGLGPL